MKKQVTIYLICIWMLAVAAPAYAVTLVNETAPIASGSQVNNSFLNGRLIARHENGRLDTSVGQYQITAGVDVDDRRPAAQWYKASTKANIQIELKAGRLVRVVIY
ncbi:hypothetical protein [Dasania marina]|uniref:hypothetical protein n=1 Tax=Dasania marina TaxID=471499 RepID=UPI00036EA411|nr:hypothetical protein [Dasania marina]